MSRRLLVLVAIFAVALLLFFGIPQLSARLTQSRRMTPDVNGHVTFVAPPVSGQIARLLVEDNNRVRKGDVLLQLDRISKPEPENC